MKKLNLEDRVRHEYLGLGTIVKIISGTSKDVFAYMVMFDNTPHKDYNNSSNPCLILHFNLEKI